MSRHRTDFIIGLPYGTAAIQRDGLRIDIGVLAVTAAQLLYRFRSLKRRHSKSSAWFQNFLSGLPDSLRHVVHCAKLYAEWSSECDKNLAFLQGVSVSVISDDY